jgi:hypothetical protein
MDYGLPYLSFFLAGFTKANFMKEGDWSIVLGA